jgi:hypothetical protein
MQSVRVTTPEDELTHVAAWLDTVGLVDFCACGDPLHPREAPLRRARDAAPEHLRDLADLLVLGEAIPEDRLETVSSDLVTALDRAGILHREAGLASLDGLVMRWVAGLWLLSERPQSNPTLYFGDDSVGLLHRLSAQPGMRALDLCAGPGVQALRLAAMGADVVAVELNPVAAALAQLNVRLNGLSKRVSVVVGDLYEAAPGLRFDRVTCNPPLLPIPDDMPYPFVGHGGSDGLRVTWRALNGLPSALRDGGVARLLGTTLSDGYVPTFMDEMDRWSMAGGMRVTVFVISHHPLRAGTAFYEGLCDTAVSTGLIDGEGARARFSAHLRERNADHLCAYFLHVTPGVGAVSLIDVSGENYRDLWFAT